MQRRLLITAFACWPATHVLAQQAGSLPRHRISATQLHEAMSARFPLRVGLASLLELQVHAPSLLLMPARNLIGAGLQARLSGLQVPQPQAGEMDIVFALRYEPADQTLRAHHPEILALRWPGLPPETARALQSLLPAMAREALGEIVLHRFGPRELALADTMGFEPEKMTVVDDGLVIEFGAKRRR